MSTKCLRSVYEVERRLDEEEVSRKCLGGVYEVERRLDEEDEAEVAGRSERGREVVQRLGRAQVVGCHIRHHRARVDRRVQTRQRLRRLELVPGLLRPRVLLAITRTELDLVEEEVSRKCLGSV